MRLTLLGLAALTAAAATSAPVAAQSLGAAGFTGSAFSPSSSNTGSGGFTGVTVHRGSGGDEMRDQGRRNRDNGGFYAFPRESYDINRVWASDSYNDWWHDRPDRAFPRWVSQNQNCERQWWSGAGWHC